MRYICMEEDVRIARGTDGMIQKIRTGSLEVVGSVHVCVYCICKKRGENLDDIEKCYVLLPCVFHRLLLSFEISVFHFSPQF